MKAFLVRIGVDQAFGGWNAPVDPATDEFVYVPIPESAPEFHPNCRRTLAEFIPAIERFCLSRKIDLSEVFSFGPEILNHPLHLDPDFEHLTYGDNGARRGAGLATLVANDLVVFYSGLRPVRKCEYKLIYALVGFYVVQEVVKIGDIPSSRWHENAHTRKLKHGESDIIVRANPTCSGCLRQCIPIGEWRKGAYRVRTDLLEEWGGLSVKEGFIQRSAVPPKFLNPDKFHEWFQKQQPILSRGNF